MAKKRMFSLGVLETDAFMDMPLSAQALYFHLNLRADDDGFIGNPKRITLNIGANIDDLKLLVAKRFVIAFEDGVIVIKHWRMHNAIKRDRYTETNFIEDLQMLEIKDNGAYTLKSGAQLEHKWSTDGEQMSQTCSTDKIRIDKDSKEETITDVIVQKKFYPPTVEEVRSYCTEKGFSFDPEAFVDFYESKNWYIGKNKMKDWKAAARNWNRHDEDKKPKADPRPKTTFHNMEERKTSYESLFPSNYG